MNENQDPQKGLCVRPEPVDNPPDSRPNPAMNKWIKELSDNAKKDGKYLADGCLFEEIPFCDECRVDYQPEYDDIDLHGSFTLKEMASLTTHMKQYQDR